MIEFKSFLIDFYANEIEKLYFDVVVIGTGVAGLYTSINLDQKMKIALVTKENITKSNTSLAQGGIAASISEEDSPDIHLVDTLKAGAGLCDEKMVQILVNEAVDNIKNLISMKIPFDLDEEGEIVLGKEGAHSRKRIVHASGDATGRIISEHLSQMVISKENIKIFENAFLIDILTKDDKAVGVLLKINSSLLLIFAKNIILASGGYGYIYKRTTNPEVTTGDGIAAALRAGCKISDIEFIQFHPTVLHHPQNQSFLISEAVRGEGAILKNIYGERFMQKYNQLQELAPRDIVSRSIFYEMQKTDSDHVFLDITFKDKEFLQKRFPNIYKQLLSLGLDLSKDLIPVSPAQHYCMGGILTDQFGRTNIRNLFSCGESSCTRVHGANRLASNSLLEGIVFGRRIAQFINENDPIEMTTDFDYRLQNKNIDYIEKLDIKKEIDELRTLMNSYAGIIKDKEGLCKLKTFIISKLELFNTKILTSKNHFEYYNMLMISYFVSLASLTRLESRGSHFRNDYPNTDDSNWKKHIVFTKTTMEVEDQC
ncbi:L-aspartate oxidase [Caldicellulosiruptoraceae bacterium PP1]